MAKSSMVHYVCGFNFNQYGDWVLLQRKNNPDWQAGFYNGIGGKLKLGESSLDGMIREFFEATQNRITTWEHFLQLTGPDWRVDFYRTKCPINFVQNPQEPLINFEVKKIDYSLCVHNLSWIIPLALDNYTVHLTEVRY